MGAPGEALLLQHLDSAREQQLRVDVLLAVALPLLALVLTRLQLRRRLRLARQIAHVAEERTEHLVVDRDVVAAGDERAAARPVEVLGREQRGSPAEVADAARPDGEPLVAKRPAEGDEALLARRRRRSAHCTRSGRTFSTRRRSS